MSSQGRSLSDPSPPPSPGVPGEGVVDRTGTRPARERRPTWLKVLLGLLLVIVLLLGCAFLAHVIWSG